MEEENRLYVLYDKVGKEVEWCSGKEALIALANEYAIRKVTTKEEAIEVLREEYLLVKKAS